MSTLVSPNRLLNLRFGYIAARSVGVAVELGLFDALAGLGLAGVEDLASALHCSQRGMRILNQALAALGLLIRQGELFSLAEEARLYLVSDSPFYLGGMILATDRNWHKWGHLDQAVTHGRPPHHGIESDGDNGAFFSQFVQGLYNLNRPAAETVAERMASSNLRVADLGAGSAVWSIPWARKGCSVVAVDRGPILEGVTQSYTREAGVESRFEFRPGNLRSVPLEEAGFDAVLLGHVLHSEGRERAAELLRRCRCALRPGGRVIVAEMVPDRERRHDVYGVLFGVNMLMLTEEGEVFTGPELEELMEASGFERWSWLDVPFPYPVLVGER